jgi:hypothetical protein
LRAVSVAVTAIEVVVALLAKELVQSLYLRFGGHQLTSQLLELKFNLSVSGGKYRNLLSKEEKLRIVGFGGGTGRIRLTGGRWCTSRRGWFWYNY